MQTSRISNKIFSSPAPKAALAALLCMLLCLFVAACEEKPGFYPNQEPYLRQPVKTLRADNSQRIYPTTAPSGSDLAARAQIGYMAQAVDIVNLGDEDWVGVEVWVNHIYVCYLPKVEHGVLKSIPFNAMFDRDGKHIPRDTGKFLVQSVDVYLDGKIYPVKFQLPH